jgi:hypothetical protein
MLLSTSLKNAQTISKRLMDCNGTILTPKGCREAIQIKSAWLFGSTIKNKPQPNDTDIIIDFDYVGKSQRDYLSVDSFIRAGIELRRGLKMVRIHKLWIDDEFAHPRIMIYPNNEIETCIRRTGLSSPTRTSV